MIGQPITAATFSDPQGVLPSSYLVQPGKCANPKSRRSPLVMLFNRPAIDFTQAQVANYSFNYVDPNDPFGLSYDVRWAVITTPQAELQAASVSS